MKITVTYGTDLDVAQDDFPDLDVDRSRAAYAALVDYHLRKAYPDAEVVVAYSPQMAKKSVAIDADDIVAVMERLYEFEQSVEGGERGDYFVWQGGETEIFTLYEPTPEEREAARRELAILRALPPTTVSPIQQDFASIDNLIALEWYAGEISLDEYARYLLVRGWREVHLEPAPHV